MLISHAGAFTYKCIFLAERFKEQKKNFLNTVAVLFKIALSMKTLAFLQKCITKKGTMTETDYETYKGLFDAMVMTPYFPHPDLLIYLEGSFDDIVDRIQERGRPMEQQTPIEYWKEMHGRYENWINNFNSCPVLRLNINEYDILKDGDSIEPIIKKIGHFFKTNT
ncbi:deoxynucleoside kinase [Bacillus cereus]